MIMTKNDRMLRDRKNEWQIEINMLYPTICHLTEKTLLYSDHTLCCISHSSHFINRTITANANKLSLLMTAIHVLYRKVSYQIISHTHIFFTLHIAARH